MLSTSQIQSLRSQLTERLAELKEQLNINNHFQLDRSALHDSTGELSSYDNHPADTATDLYERGKDVALNEHAEQELEEIQIALKAIDNGNYGTCKTCGQDIPFERLQAIPTTLFCKEHSPSQNISKDHSIEEEIDRPFGRFEFDEKSATFYDSEDSWQDVARYGTSETPSDLMGDQENYGETYIEGEDRIGYVEDYENFAAVDLYGKPVEVYPSRGHDIYEQTLDEEGIMTAFGDLPPAEKEPYVEDK